MGSPFDQGPSFVVPAGTKLPPNIPYYTDEDGFRIFPPDGGWPGEVGADRVSESDVGDFNRSIETGPDSGNEDYREARAPDRNSQIDPLALDLDTDGVETTGATGRIHFDHSGDGIRTGTGWVRGDDGLLVLDRNGDGSIDSGAELFGADTVLLDGSTGADGFTALREQDSNGDGVFSAADAEFANVRVWQDANQDGVSQAEELTSLAEQGITEISLSDTLIDAELGNGNAEHSRASFSRADGSTGTASALNLAHNPFYRVFPDSIPLTAEAEALPNMQGSGMVRSLREGASLDSALATLLADASDGTRAAVDANLDDIILSWAGTGDIQTSIEGIEQATGYGSVYGWQQIGFKSVADPSEIPQELLDWAGERYEEPEVVENGAPLDSRLLRRFVSGNSYLGSDDFIGALEAFNGLAFLEFRQTESGHWEIYTGNGDPNTPSAGGGGGGGGGGVASDPDMYVYLDGRAIYGAVGKLFSRCVGNRPVAGRRWRRMTYLKPYLDEVRRLVIDESAQTELQDLRDRSTRMLEAEARHGFRGRAGRIVAATLNMLLADIGRELGWDGPSTGSRCTGFAAVRPPPSISGIEVRTLAWTRKSEILDRQCGDPAGTGQRADGMSARSPSPAAMAMTP